MEKLIVLGTGSAGVKKCYNTCFALKKDDEYFLVDGGGGGTILKQLEDANIPTSAIHNIFVSHNHIDHIIGVIWVIRDIANLFWNDADYIGDLNIYASEETSSAIKMICNLLLNRRQFSYIGNKIKLITIQDREEKEILNENILFFDIYASKEKQFGFKILNSNVTFAGDEPCKEQNYDIVKNSNWLFHEVLCLYRDKDIFEPYKKGHCTVKEASELANELNVANLLLWHTEEKTLENRRELYTKEAKQYFDGNIYIPNDLDVIDLI